MIKGAVVTGATSMVGSAIVRTCVDHGIKVLALIRPGSKRRYMVSEIPGATVLECDLDNIKELDISSTDRYDAFFDIGWTGSASNLRDDVSLQVKNIASGIEAVRLAKKFGCEVFVGAGSQAECGRFEGDLNVNTPANPETGYGAAKYATQIMTRIECEKLGIRHVWSRILSVYGPGDAPQTMVMSTIATVMRGEQPKFTPGEQLWDYMYVDDCATALLALACKGKHGTAYPVGSGVARPLSEFVNKLCTSVCPSIKPDFGAIPYSDKQVMKLRADTTSLERDTGFKPEITFEEGIARTVEWYRSVNGR